jgi:hypothetical protein
MVFRDVENLIDGLAFAYFIVRTTSLIVAAFDLFNKWMGTMKKYLDEIWVVYKDGMMGVVYPENLQELIELNEIIKFERSDGWVYLTIDPVRRTDVNSHRDVERRRMQNSNLNQAINY